MIALVLSLACTGDDDIDPGVLCREEGTATCCYDEDCSSGFCWHSWTCVTKKGRLVCEAPVGDRQCHELCTFDSGGESDDCPILTEECQGYPHAQGDDYEETISACF
ncbi:MAG TPA: hypothetical protein QGF58_08010 [Myxococcota bacterium]|nr:hypothetical protein [Myxococcota bacterium]